MGTIFERVKRMTLPLVSTHKVEKQMNKICISKEKVKTCGGLLAGGLGGSGMTKSKMVKYACVPAPSSKAEGLKRRAMGGEALDFELNELPVSYTKMEKEPISCGAGNGEEVLGGGHGSGSGNGGYGMEGGYGSGLERGGNGMGGGYGSGSGRGGTGMEGGYGSGLEGGAIGMGGGIGSKEECRDIYQHCEENFVQDNCRVSGWARRNCQKFCNLCPVSGVEGGLGEGVEGGFRGMKVRCGGKDRNVPPTTQEKRRCNSNQNCEFWQMSSRTKGWFCCAKHQDWCQ